jgi:hypothetical protein
MLKTIQLNPYARPKQRTLQMRNKLIALNVVFITVCSVLIYHLITHESDDEPQSVTIPSSESDFSPFGPSHDECLA